MRLLRLCSILALILSSASAWAQIDARMLRYPDVSATHIAFAYAGDIWIVPKTGGVAQRLSTPRGEEVFPRFSPDGASIAYSANYDGNMDIYVVPTSGGLPVRVTHHPAMDRIVDWWPDGQSLLFATGMVSGRDRFNQFYKVSPAGGLPEALPLPYAEFGAVAADGRTLAYVPLATDFRTWKRYRGGMASEIWLFDLKTFEWKNMTQDPANDSQPMWRGSTLYFLSDRGDNQRSNLWAYNRDTGAFRQVTDFKDYDVRFPAIGPSDIVFECGGRLYLLDLATEKTREVPVQVVTDRATLKPRMTNVSKLLRNASVSPSGKRAIVEARGEVFSLPAEHGPVINLTQSPGVAERHAAWSPDGKLIAYFSDRTGEYELTVRPSDGSGAERTVTSIGPGYRYNLYWSPDSKKVAFVDQAMRLQVADIESGKVSQIDKGLFMYHGELAGFPFSWSADSRWIAYHRDLTNQSTGIFLHDTKTGKSQQVISGFYAASSPVFDPEGKYLYFFVGDSLEPVYSDLDGTWIYPNTTRIAAVPLRKDVPSPLAPRNDKEGEEEKKDDAKKDDAKKDDTKKDDAKVKSDDKAKAEGKDEKASDKKADDEKKDKPAPKPVEIDVEHFENRLVVLPPAAGNFGGLAAVEGKVIFHRRPRTGLPRDEKSPILYYDIKEREEKTIVGDADGFEVSADGKKMLVVKKSDFAIIDIKPEQKMDKKLATGELEMLVDPPAEWRQIFNDAWRIERDYFYDPKLHGVDWKKIKERYGKLLDDAVTRWDVNFIIGELIGELNASHTYRGGGDVEQAPERGVGLLGADFALENGAYRIKKIVSGAPWDSEARSPLALPGVDVKEGDYLLAVNRIPLSIKEDPWAAFQGLAGKTVLLTVNSKPTTEGAREVLVETMSSEERLRYLAWIEGMRRRVEEATDGRVGYVYVPSTGRDGQTELVRQFRPQIDKEGLIIDERFNSGGQIPDRFVELLNRPVTNYWGVRDGVDWQWPPVAHPGPKVMLMNGWSGSGGDAFPFYFKKAGLGPLIGMRTWGGLIGISGAPPLIDGGNVTAPTFGIYSTDGKWIIEGHGVEPDIEVVDDPSAMAKGRDPQLERAIQEVQRLIQQKPPRRPAKPAYPDRSGN